jgi:putative ubiquitin-RnfH superfamily antitoxin RatB of RatAB toxin-antitoxin module
MRVEVVLARPREHRAVVLELPAQATVADALAASGLPLEGIDGYAVFGVRVAADAPLRPGDRVELLRPLLLDPKEARRRRAASPRG